MAAIRRHLTHLAVLFVLALVATSCGGSSADPVDAAPAVADSAPETTITEPPSTEAPDDSMDMEDEEMHGTDEEGHEDEEDEVHEDEGHEDEGHEDEGHEDEGHGDEGDGEAQEVPEDARVVFVFMNEYGYEPADFSATPGETVVYRIMNTGDLPHEFRLSNAHRVEEHIASGHEGHGEEGEGGHHEADGDIAVELEPGLSTELVVTFPMDESIYTMVVCLIPEHYERGMHSELTYS